MRVDEHEVGDAAAGARLLVAREGGDRLRQLLAVSEAYPTLRASEQFLALQHQLVMTEDRIQAARRFFNGNVRDFNRRVESVPSNIVAGLFGFTRESYFELDPLIGEAAAPTTSF
jgi:LemA protein